MIGFRLTAAIAMLAISAFGCERAPDSPAAGERREPVVVYAAFEDDADLRERLARYTEETGVLAIVRRGAGADIVTDVIENKVSPPADVLVTRSVKDVWRAAEEGALRPIASQLVVQRSPKWARDPDGLWAATEFEAAAIVTATAVDIDAATFAAIGGGAFRRRDMFVVLSRADESGCHRVADR